jgi:hypothetical protein
MPAHIWEITQQGFGLLISTRWEGGTDVGSFSGRLVAGEPVFLISGENSSRAILVDKQHFVVPGWCTNDTRGGVGPNYDVIFSRPGIAELTARQAYQQYLAQLSQTEN